MYCASTSYISCIFQKRTQETLKGFEVLKSSEMYHCQCRKRVLFLVDFQNKANTVVRCGSHWGGSPQNGLGDEQTCGTTLASAYVLHHLSAAWLQLQMMERSPRWE